VRYLIWDFDGTLGYREGMWSATLVEVARRTAPGRAVTEEQVRPFLLGTAGIPGTGWDLGRYVV